MKILIVNNFHAPGTVDRDAMGFDSAAKALRGRGHTVHVLSTPPNGPAPEADRVDRRLRLADEWNANAPGAIPAQQRAVLSRSRFVDAQNVYELTRVVEGFRPDVAFLGDLVGVGGLGLVAALRHLAVPWVWWLGGGSPARLCSTAEGVVAGLAAEFSRRLQGSFLVASDVALREAEALGLRLNGDVRRFPFWIDGQRPAPRPAFDREKTLRVMAVGTVRRSDEFDRLVNAARRLVDSGATDFRIDVYGKVVDQGARALVSGEGLAAYFRLHGPPTAAELPALYGEHDVLAFPTGGAEAHGKAPLEALSRGCLPVLAGRCAAAEWLVHGVHCLKTDETADGLAEGLFSVISGGVDVAPIVRRGAEAAWRDFHIDALASRIETTLDEARRRPRTTPGDPAEACRLATMAEQLALSFLNEASAAG